MPLRHAACCFLLLVLCATGVRADEPAPADRDLRVESDTVRQHIEQIMDRAVSGGDMESAAREATGLFLQVAVWAEINDSESFVAADGARRLLSCLSLAKRADQKSLLAYFRENPEFARALSYQITPHDEPDRVFALAERLIRDRGDGLNKYANLAAAICLVFDEPLIRNVNENVVEAEDPVRLFDYYVANENRMLLGIRNMPTELLIYVVDCTASIQEMNWALNNYAGDEAVGKRFFDIRYDSDHARRGSQKHVTAAGFNLPNIKKYGGVCADQAYFAVSIGKAIGVPTTYTVGRSAEVGHAWVGYLQSDGRRAAWNFNEGRYEVYQGIRGIVQDPQTRRVIPDSYVSVLGEMIGCDTQDRYTAIALVDAARILQAVRAGGEPADPPYFMEGTPPTEPRDTSTATRLKLLEAGLRHNPGCVQGWLTLAEMAAAGELSLDDKKRWSDVLLMLCGDRYPDFTLDILEPMIQTIDDPDEQNRIWQAAAELFTTRKDLSAQILMLQGQMWLKHGEPKKAGRCYEAVVVRYVNDGPFVLQALDQIESILRNMNEPRKVLQLYNETWGRVERPGRMAPEFRVQSNWYRIGKRYAERLRQQGFDAEAAKAEKTIERVTGG